MKQKCVHCGEDCGRNPIIWNDKPFCCNGCKAVYQLINQNKLYTYYKLEDTPGIKIDADNLSEKFSYLDKDDVKEKVYDFKEGDIVKVVFYIPSIHCASCVWLLENLNTLNNGVSSSMVNFIKKEVSVTFNDAEITLRQLVELLSSLHYIPIITLEKKSSIDEQKEEGKRILKRIGVAGFAFGNTMLLSFPEYIQGSFGLEERYRALFGILNLFFATPVVIYSAKDYILSGFKNLFKKIINIDLPVAIGILTIFFESSYEILSRTGAGYMDSLTGFVFFLLIGKWYQNKTYKALSFERDYKSYFPIAATVLRDGKEDSILIENLKVDDEILVRNRELIPADSQLLKGKAYIDYSFVTGESKTVKKNVGDTIFAGGRQVGEALELKIVANVEQSKLTSLWNSANLKSDEKKIISNIIDLTAKYFTIFVLLIAFSSALYWLFTDKEIVIKTFTSVLIVACPCALALSLPFTFGTLMGIFGKTGFYLKKTSVLENLSKIDTIVFDKTGTITMSDSLNVNYKGEKLSDKELSALKSITRQSTHPMSSAVYDYLKKYEFVETENFRELPARGIIGEFGGNKIKLGSHEFIFGENPFGDIDETRVYLSLNDVFMGYFIVENKYRKGLHEIIENLDKDYDLHLISGDNNSEKTKLLSFFKGKDKLNFYQSPEDKMIYIQKLQAKGKAVLMIGDGLNDAGALQQSDFGISIADDIYHFSPACDAILEAGKFSRLYKYIRFSKTAIIILRISFLISIIYNILGLSFAVRGMLSPIIAAILMPASSVTVVAFVSFATILMARIKKISV